MFFNQKSLIIGSGVEDDLDLGGAKMFFTLTPAYRADFDGFWRGKNKSEIDQNCFKKCIKILTIFIVKDVKLF